MSKKYVTTTTIICDQCGKESDQIGCSVNGTPFDYLDYGWSHNTKLLGWAGFSVNKTDAQVLIEAKAEAPLGWRIPVNPQEHYEVCSEKCEKQLLRQRAIGNSRIVDRAEYGIPPHKERS